MKDVNSMTDEEIMNELSSLDPEEMTDEEIMAELGQDDELGVGDIIDYATKPIQYAANLLDYPVSAPRRGFTELAKEVKRPGSTGGTAIEAFGRGAVSALSRNPFEYDKESSWSELYKEMGVPSKTLQEVGAPKIKTSGPFSTAYNIARKIPVNEVAGFATDIVVDPFTVAGKVGDVVGLTRGTMGERAIQNTSKSLARQSVMPRNDMIEMVNTGKLDSSSKTLQELGLTKFITDPQMLYEQIAGVTKKVEDPRVPGRLITKKVAPGVTDEIGKKIGEQIRYFDSVLDSNSEEISRAAMADAVFKRLDQKFSNIRSGAPYSPEDSQKVSEMVDKIFKTQTDAKTNLEDMIGLKRAAQEYFYELSSSQAADVLGSKNLKNIYSEVERTIDDLMTAFILNKPDVDKRIALDFIKNNQQYSDLKAVEKMLAGSNYESLNEIMPVDMIPGMILTGAATGAAGLNPMIGAGMYGGARSAGTAISGGMPSYSAKVQDLLYRTGVSVPYKAYTGPGVPAALATRSLTGEEQGRQPQSIITADTVAQYEIPRDTARIMGEQDMVMAKLQMEVKDPQILGMASQLFSGLQRNPESVKPMISQLANMFPQIFEKDKYNRFDGKVDPAIVPIAIEDIRKSQMPTIEKASKIESLYNTGLLVD